MKILCTGKPERFAELCNKLSSLKIDYVEPEKIEEANLIQYDVIFDVSFDDFPYNIHLYKTLQNKMVILSAVKYTLAEAIDATGNLCECTLAGLNCLNGFIDKNLWEMSVLNDDDAEKIKTVLSNLNVAVKFVEDRTGMVTPRVIMMIINEAYFTVQEKTASRNDIDTAMKLGTNYPYGPFEWCEKIGIADVYETLEAVYNDTGDERYRICPLMKKEYLLNKNS